MKLGLDKSDKIGYNILVGSDAPTFNKKAMEILKPLWFLTWAVTDLYAASV